MITPKFDPQLALLATEIPGWRWMVGMVDHHDGRRWSAYPGHIATVPVVTGQDDPLPDYRDPATAGCLLELLGSEFRSAHGPDKFGECGWRVHLARHHADEATLGGAIIRAALAIGRWPGGAP